MFIYSMGYEKSSIEDYLATLKEHGITLLVDVRAIAASRRKGFAKRAIMQNCEDAGIEYQHFPALGDPKEGREAMRRGDKQAFEEIFDMHMTKKESGIALERLVEIAKKKTACLMCYEQNYADCHRTRIINTMENSHGFQPKHIEVRCAAVRRQFQITHAAQHDEFSREKNYHPH